VNKSTTDEKWKDVFGFEGLYKISNHGRVLSLYNNIIRKQFMPENRYPKVVISKNKKKYMKYIHRMVAMAFIPNPQNKKEVNHKDGNKFNNAISNLEWVTPKENQQHSIKTGLFAVGARANKSTLTDSAVLFMRKNYKLNDKKFGSKALAAMFNIKQSIAKEAISGRTWKYI